MYAVVIPLVALVTERGASPTAAAWVLGLCGAGQTLGRTLYATLVRHTGVTTRTVTLIVAGGATTAASRSHRARTPYFSSWPSRRAWSAATSPFSRPPPSRAAGAPFASAIAHFAGAALAGELGGIRRPSGLLPVSRSVPVSWPRRPSDADGMGAGRDQARRSRCRSISSARLT